MDREVNLHLIFKYGHFGEWLAVRKYFRWRDCSTMEILVKVHLNLLIVSLPITVRNMEVECLMKSAEKKSVASTDQLHCME